MALCTLKYGASISLLVLLAAFLYKRHTDEVLQERLRDVLSGLLRAEKKVPLEKQRVAIGFGGCEDIFGDAMKLFELMNLSAPKEIRHHDSVKTAKELSQLFAYFFQHGAAAERYISNSTLFDKLIEGTLQQKDHWRVMGGNAVVMAERMATEGLDVMLGARLSQEITDSLSKHMKVIGKPVQRSDIHLVLEYATGDKWGNLISPRANRLIVHNDKINPFLDGMEDFIQEVVTFQPSLIVIGGLQMMDNFPHDQGIRQARLGKLREFLQQVPQSTHVHFEMASFTDMQLLTEIVDNVIYYSDSLGMNEQELPNLISALEGGNVTLVSDSYPRVASVLDQMRTVYGLLSTTKEVNGRKKLARLHVHTLAFQAILTTQSSTWKNTMSSAAKAALTAHRHTCGSHDIDTLKARLIMDDSFSLSKTTDSKRIPVKDDRPVACWVESDFHICIAPVLVCTDVKQTAGGGDNISSAGLVLQV